MTKQVKEVYTDLAGTTTVEYDDDSTSKFNQADQLVLSTGGITIGGSTPTAAHRDSLLDGLGGPGLDKAYPLPSICFLGDSLTNDSASEASWTQWGWVTHFRRMVFGRAIVLPENEFAIASIGVVDLNTVQVPLAIASGCKIACVMIGTNDVGSVDIVAGLETAYASLLDAGITVIAGPILPHSAPSSFSAADKAIVDNVNRYIANKAATTRGIVYAPTLQYVTDFATGDAITGLLRDGIHTTPSGAYRIARGFFDAVDKVLPSAAHPILVASNSYDATTNPHGDILANGLMLGTSGSVINGATGTVPTGWLGQRSDEDSSTGATMSKEVDAATGINKAVVTLSATGDGSYVGFEVDAFSIPAGIVAGDEIELVAFAEWEGLVNSLGVYARLRSSDGTTFTESYDGVYNDDNGLFDLAGDGSGWLNVRYTVPTDVTSPSVQLQVATKSGEDVEGVVKFSQVSLRKVIS